MISAAQLASMQATMATTRTDSADILRRTEETDDGGGSVVDWVAVLTVPCRVAPQGMQSWEQLDKIEGKVVDTSVWTIALPPGTEVRSQDRIAVGALTYSVIASKAPRTLELERAVQVVLVS
jgi:hypothetical protein